MPSYFPLANIMPVASMVSGAVVTAALCDQIRDNLVALWEGWWFRATRSTTQAIGASATTLIVMDTLAQSATSLTDGSIALSAGSVATTKPGLWLVGGHFWLQSTTTGTLFAILESTDAPSGVYTASDINDTGSNKQASSASATTEVTSAANTFDLRIFNTASCTVLNDPMTALWGVWLGDNV